MAPFVIRFETFCEHGLFPESVAKGFDALPNFSKWSKAVTSQESVTYVFDKQSIANGAKARMEKMKADKKH